MANEASLFRGWLPVSVRFAPENRGADGVFTLHAGRKDFFDTLSLSAGAVDDLADLPFAETELSRKRPVVAAVEPGPDVPVTGVAL